jgi:hypothetical protein
MATKNGKTISHKIMHIIQLKHFIPANYRADLVSFPFPIKHYFSCSTPLERTHSLSNKETQMEFLSAFNTCYFTNQRRKSRLSFKAVDLLAASQQQHTESGGCAADCVRE